MKKSFDSELEGKLDELRTTFPMYSPNEEFVLRIGWDLRSAHKSLIPNRWLELVECKLDCYAMRKDANPKIIEGLNDIIDHAWNLYGEMEVAA